MIFPIWMYYSTYYYIFEFAVKRKINIKHVKEFYLIYILYISNHLKVHKLWTITYIRFQVCANSSHEEVFEVKTKGMSPRISSLPFRSEFRKSWKCSLRLIYPGKAFEKYIRQDKRSRHRGQSPSKIVFHCLTTFQATSSSWPCQYQRTLLAQRSGSINVAASRVEYEIVHEIVRDNGNTIPAWLKNGRSFWVSFESLSLRGTAALSRVWSSSSDQTTWFAAVCLDF